MSFTRSIFIFLGALIFSVLLWSYVRLSSAYESDVDFPVKLTPPKGYALASGLPERIHARVRGAGWQILVMNFAKNAHFRFDLTDRLVVASTPLVIHSDEITSSAVMPSELRVLKVDPDSLGLQFSNVIEKLVPVESRVNVTPGRNYVRVGTVKVSPAMVKVIGAASILDTLKSISTETVEIADAKEDVERAVSLSHDLDNFVTIPNNPKIAVHVEIQAVGERAITGVPVAIEALPPQYEVLFIPSAVTVTLRGGVDLLAKLAPSSVRVHVPFDPMVFDTAHTITPRIEIPVGTTFLGEDPPRLKFIVRKKAEGPRAKPGAGGSHVNP